MQTSAGGHSSILHQPNDVLNHFLVPSRPHSNAAAVCPAEMWKQAENAEQNLEEASNNLKTAQEKFDEVEKQYNETKAALEQILAASEGSKKDLQDQIDVLEEEKEDKEHTLNGGLGDQLLRSVIEGDGSALADAGKEIAALELKALLGGLSEEEQKKLDELKGSVETTKQVAEIIGGVSDGSIDQEDLEKVVNLVKEMVGGIAATNTVHTLPAAADGLRCNCRITRRGSVLSRNSMMQKGCRSPRQGLGQQKIHLF